MNDKLEIGGIKLESRLFVGTGKFADYNLIPEVIKASKTQVVTVALRRVDFDNPIVLGRFSLPALKENDNG